MSNIKLSCYLSPDQSLDTQASTYNIHTSKLNHQESFDLSIHLPWFNIRNGYLVRTATFTIV